jgi:hypothetical protein
MLLLACVLVFAFALHAKLGMYVAGSQPDASTASKLWTDAAKWQPPPIIPSAALMWLAVFVASLLCTQLADRYIVALEEVPREQGSRRYLHRFLRPPPAH